MCFIQLIKRFAPFLLTFALGLLVASFFVTVAAPNFSKFKGGNRNQKYNRLQSENERMQDRIKFLERRNAQLESEKMNVDSDFEETFLPVPPPAPPAPPAPKRIR